ncbi:hypothetical protein TrVFT333_001316 [Trichoderma virens FT-333]|nr:hypothetical protein TrVFT333_001316 [Trichoderma virens FT-333]
MPDEVYFDFSMVELQLTCIIQTLVNQGYFTSDPAEAAQTATFTNISEGSIDGGPGFGINHTVT